jgi:MOSC domain-containing protein YiiM
VRFNDVAMTKHFARARRNGIYFLVVEEGVLRVGDSIHLVKRSDYSITIQDVVDCYALPKKNPELVKQILAIPFLPQLLKSSFEYLSE